MLFRARIDNAGRISPIGQTPNTLVSNPPFVLETSLDVVPNIIASIYPTTYLGRNPIPPSFDAVNLGTYRHQIFALGDSAILIALVDANTKTIELRGLAVGTQATSVRTPLDVNVHVLVAEANDFLDPLADVAATMRALAATLIPPAATGWTIIIGFPPTGLAGVNVNFVQNLQTSGHAFAPYRPAKLNAPPPPVPANPAPANPAPVDPAPVDPAPVDPAPKPPTNDPAPTNPAPVDADKPANGGNPPPPTYNVADAVSVTPPFWSLSLIILAITAAVGGGVLVAYFRKKNKF